MRPTTRSTASAARRRLTIAAAALAASASLLAPRTAAAVTFNLTPAAGMDPQAVAGFQAAADRWSSLLADNVTVNINIGFSALGAGILGQASTSTTFQTYTNTRNAIFNDRLSTDDFTAYANLRAGNGVDVLNNRTSQNGNAAATYFDNDDSINNTNLRVGRANAKALGLLGASGSPDASITFSSGFSWDFDPKNGVTAGAFDFVGAATHEIGHALGFTSGVDVHDSNPGLSENSSTYQNVSPLDLFRYSANSVALGAGVVDWSADNRAKYFSIDGGATSLATFATGITFGDGRQASHWKDNLGLGALDPTAAPGETVLVTALDRQAFDVIGWNPNNSWRWVDAAGGNFNSAIRWSSTAVPGGPQTAVFDLPATYAITFNAAQGNAAANIKAGAVTFNLNANVYAASQLNVAPLAGENATLIVGGSGGGINSVSANVGGDSAAAGGTGVLQLNPGASILAIGQFRVWPNGTLKFNGGSLGGSAAVNVIGGKLQAATAATVAQPVNIGAGGGTVQVDAGTFTFTGPFNISGGVTATKTGPGTLAIVGSQVHGNNATFTAAAGTTLFNTNAGSPAQPGALAVNANAAVHFNATQNLKSLTVGAAGVVTLAAGGTRSIKAAALDVAPGGTLDLNDNRIVVDYTGATPAAAVRADIAAAANGGSWDTPGITTSLAADTGLFGVGYAEAADVIDFGFGSTAAWGGQTIDQTALLLRYTYVGDANLDGTIDGGDYAFIDSFVGAPDATWTMGDFNYDGYIDGGDYAYIDVNVITAQANPLSAAAGADAALLATIGDAHPMTAVPEPGAAAAAAALLMLTATRRRRRTE